MVLQRVVGEVLASFGEHHAVDLGGTARPGQGDVLIDLGQPAAEGTDGPLQPRIAFEDRLLVGEVPDATTPILEIDVAESCAPGPRISSTVAAMQPAAVGGRTERFGKQRCAGAGLRARPASGRGRHRRRR